LEFEGAKYHVGGRGNYRKELFTMGGAGEAFERALLETAESARWRIHTFVVMSNHYHLAVETPVPNLSEWMGRLLGVFATRFNRIRGESGHVFQGRYKSLLVEPGSYWAGLIDYIHLNPVRAGLCGVEELETFGIGSYRHYWQRKFPGCLERRTLLSDLGFPDNHRGMRNYAKYLEVVAEEDRSKNEELMQQYTRGWALASKEYKQALLKDHQELEAAFGSASGEEYQVMREALWESIVARYLKEKKLTEEAIHADAKSAPWKVGLARTLRKEGARNGWIAIRLRMGGPSWVSALVHERERPSERGYRSIKK
jgi:REP element-mobilizing transposase RayT